MKAKSKSFILFIVLSSLFSSTAIYAAEFKGKVGQYSAYFTDSERFRHNRLELHLLQNTSFGYRFSTVIEGRFRYDLALTQDDYKNLDRSVWDDELSESEIRQAYFGYLGDSFKLTAGLQIIDWMDALSNNSTDILTPLDLRHGSFGDARQVVEPMTAIVLNHKVGESTLEWLVAPQATYSRFPKEENGYGYYERIREESGRINTTIVDGRKEDTLENAEAAFRFLSNFDLLEWTIIGWYGHQRSPVIEWEQQSSRQATATLTNPRVTTAGTSISIADASYVFRASLFYQPDRRPVLLELLDDEKNDVFVTRTRFGLGFDYLFSQHFKFYSDHFILNDKTTGSETFLDPDADTDETTYLHTVRLTNETFENTEIILDALFMHPDGGHILIPQFKKRFFEDYEFELGARLIQSDADDSVLELLDKADHYYLAFYYNFSVIGE